MTPDLRIRADGRDITAAVRDRLVSLKVTDSVDADADACELVLDDRGAAVELPPAGAVLEVDLGWRAQGVAPMGRFVVDERELHGPPDTLTLRAAAADLAGDLKAPRTRSWDRATLGALAGAVAAANGLRLRVDPRVRGLVLPHIDQVDESDLGILRRLARDLDLVARPAGGELVVAPRHALAAGRPAAATVRRGDVADYRFLEADRDAYAAVLARWRGADAAEPMTVRAEGAGGAGGPVHSLSSIYPDRPAALNAAEARLRALEREAVTACVTLARGLPELTAEAAVDLAGFGPPRGRQMGRPPRRARPHRIRRLPHHRPAGARRGPLGPRLVPGRLNPAATERRRPRGTASAHPTLAAASGELAQPFRVNARDFFACPESAARAPGA